MKFRRNRRRSTLTSAAPRLIDVGGNIANVISISRLAMIDHFWAERQLRERVKPMALIALRVRLSLAHDVFRGVTMMSTADDIGADGSTDAVPCMAQDKLRTASGMTAPQCFATGCAICGRQVISLQRELRQNLGLWPLPRLFSCLRHLSRRCLVGCCKSTRVQSQHRVIAGLIVRWLGGREQLTCEALRADDRSCSRLVVS